MELIWIAVGFVVVGIIVVFGIAWMSMPSRTQRHGPDRQEYERPPHGSRGNAGESTGENPSTSR